MVSRHTVLIVEDNPQICNAYSKALTKVHDLFLVGIAEDLPEGLYMLEQTRPDVLLVDIGLPSGSGIELIRQAVKVLPNCSVMVITVFGDERHVIECIEAGASGYLLKGIRENDLIEQIHALCEGGSPISPIIARQLLSRFRTAEMQAKSCVTFGAPKLSSQERIVLEMSAKGFSYGETARIHNLSTRTVETYIRRIYQKLQVNSRCEAIYEARKLGLLQD